MDNKKSGIRLRHLQQVPEQPKKRDVSPNNANRKKIFDSNQRKFNDKLVIEQKRNKNEQNHNSQYEQLVQNLKKKTMEIELRDEAIKYLNKQIEDLKNQLKLKDKQIAKLNQQISFFQKSHINVPPQKDNYAFPPFQNQFTSFSNIDGSNKVNQSLQTYDKKNYQEKRFHQQVSLGNLNYKNHFEQSVHEGQILSPFMALNNQRSVSSHIGSKQKGENSNRRNNTSRLESEHQLINYSTQYSGFNKKKQNKQFNFSQQDKFGRKVTMIDSVNKQLEKFNIFGEAQQKKQIFVRNQLQIQDSRQFKFQDFDKGFHDFNRY